METGVHAVLEEGKRTLEGPRVREDSRLLLFEGDFVRRGAPNAIKEESKWQDFKAKSSGSITARVTVSLARMEGQTFLFITQPFRARASKLFKKAT
jgi:hypothetical protein